MAEQNRREANMDSPEVEQQEAEIVLENTVQRMREQTRSEAPETNSWMDSAKDTAVTVLKKGGGVLLKGGKGGLGLIGAVLYFVKESLKEIKEDFKEKIVNRAFKVIGLPPLKINKGEKKDDK